VNSPILLPGVFGGFEEEIHLMFYIMASPNGAEGESSNTDALIESP
jgi:hypothetical protein